MKIMIKKCIYIFFLFFITGNIIAGNKQREISLTLIPPSPITNNVNLDIRAGIWNHISLSQKFDAIFYLNNEDEKSVLYKTSVVVESNCSRGVAFSLDTKDKTGNNTIILIVRSGEKVYRAEKPLEIIDSKLRSTQRIDGTWAGIYHWSEEEGKLWNSDIKNLSDSQWGEIVKGMHEIKMDIIVIQEVFRNQEYVGKHSIETDGYQGKAFYPSSLYPERMPIAAKDPVEAILSEADKNGMSVFLGVGLYAWFDYTPASLEWHKKTAKELWDKYGHHESFYGWYVSEEIAGSLEPWEKDKKKAEIREKEICSFFKEFKSYCVQLAPDKPVMLATNSFYILKAIDTYPQLLSSLDILCPFGFARMPEDDLSGRDAAMVLQQLCDNANSHLWLDLEIFSFDDEGGLYPRPMEEVIGDLERFSNFEKILCYQYPGLLNNPNMSVPLGGQKAVTLYLDYKKYIENLKYGDK